MTTNVTRREMLTSLGSATAAFLFSGSALLSGRQTCAMAPGQLILPELSSAIEAEHGFPVEWVGETRLAGPYEALYDLYNSHGLRWEFSSRVGYGESSQCKDQFQQCERDFRQYGNNYFTDVKRSINDRDIAFLAGGTYQDNYRFTSVYGATQYQGNAAQRLVNDDPGIVSAAGKMYNEIYRPTPKEQARSTAVMAISDIATRVPDGVLYGRSYTTPNSLIYHYAQPATVGRRYYRKGIVGVQNRNANDSMKFKGLYM